jgi:hypothetical protein
MDNKTNSENKSYTPQGYIAELRKTVKIPKDKEEEVRKQLSPLFTDFYPSSAKFLRYKKYESNFAEKTKKASQTLSQLFEIVSSFREATTEITTER